jgi:hypothetical protein
LLNVLPINIQWQVVRINNGLDEIKVFWKHFLELVVDQDSSDKELDFVFLFVELFELIVRGSFRNVHQSSEIDIAFGLEMGPGERVACVLEDIFVEFFVLRF